MKIDRIIYYVATGLLSALMLFSASMYFFNTAVIKEAFINYGFPSYIVIPLGILKILGLIAIWTRLSALLKEWAYAGYFFNFVFAAVAHLVANDGEAGGAILALILLITSYVFDKRVFGKSLV